MTLEPSETVLPPSCHLVLLPPIPHPSVVFQLHSRVDFLTIYGTAQL